MLKDAVQYIQKKLAHSKIDLGMILGSGLGIMVEGVERPITIPYRDIPGFPISKVAGHAGRLVIGKIGEKSCVIMQGRVHYYEGHTMEDLAFPVRVMHALGADQLIITCASGGVNKDLAPGDIMLIDDQVNFSFQNPLIISGTGTDVAFIDSSQVYSSRLKKLTVRIAKRLDTPIQRGVYFFMTGPNYETGAEIKMIRTLGGDMAGMSTFPESLEAYKLGMEVLGLSYISNMGTGISETPLYHEEVVETIEGIKKPLRRLIFELIKTM